MECKLSQESAMMETLAQLILAIKNLDNVFTKERTVMTTMLVPLILAMLTPKHAKTSPSAAMTTMLVQLILAIFPLVARMFLSSISLK